MQRESTLLWDLMKGGKRKRGGVKEVVQGKEERDKERQSLRKVKVKLRKSRREGGEREKLRKRENGEERERERGGGD